MERISAKCEKRDLHEIEKIEKKLRSVDIITKLFPGSDRKIVHVLKENGGVKTYLGIIRKLKKNNDYNIDYEMATTRPII